MSKIHIMIETRLLHGQVGTVWTQYYKTDKIIVVNDAIVQDQIRQKVMKVAAPLDCEVFFSTVSDCVSVDEKSLILVSNPQDALSLWKQGISFEELLVSHMEEKAEAKQVSEMVFVTCEDVEAFLQLKEHHVNCFIQRFPDAVIEDNTGLFEK